MGLNPNFTEENDWEVVAQEEQLNQSQQEQEQQQQEEEEETQGLLDESSAFMPTNDSEEQQGEDSTESINVLHTEETTTTSTRKENIRPPSLTPSIAMIGSSIEKESKRIGESIQRVGTTLGTQGKKLGSAIGLESKRLGQVTKRAVQDRVEQLRNNTTTSTTASTTTTTTTTSNADPYQETAKFKLFSDICTAAAVIGGGILLAKGKGRAGATVLATGGAAYVAGEAMRDAHVRRHSNGLNEDLGLHME